MQIHNTTLIFRTHLLYPGTAKHVVSLKWYFTVVIRGIIRSIGGGQILKSQAKQRIS